MFLVDVVGELYQPGLVVQVQPEVATPATGPGEEEGEEEEAWEAHHNRGCR